jgi:hypothetical protein
MRIGRPKIFSEKKLGMPFFGGIKTSYITCKIK